VGSARIKPRRDRGAHAREDLGGFHHARHWDMSVRIAAAEKDRCAVERAPPTPDCADGPDQAASQEQEAAESRSLSKGELGRQTGALREAEHHDA
jgi:hypothetical protein